MPCPYTLMESVCNLRGCLRSVLTKKGNLLKFLYECNSFVDRISDFL